MLWPSICFWVEFDEKRGQKRDFFTLGRKTILPPPEISNDFRILFFQKWNLTQSRRKKKILRFLSKKVKKLKMVKNGHFWHFLTFWKKRVFGVIFESLLNPLFWPLFGIISLFSLILLTGRCLKKGSKKGSKIDPLLGYPPKMQTKAPTGKFFSSPDDKIHVVIWSIWDPKISKKWLFWKKRKFGTQNP